MDRNSETMGHIKGLLEAWRPDNQDPDPHNAICELDSTKQWRLSALFSTLHPGFVVSEMDKGFPSTVLLLQALSKLG